MKCFTLTSFALAVLLPTLAVHADDNAGFKPIFNGENLDGWIGHKEFWRVEDGHIIGQTTKENPTRGNTFLIGNAGLVGAAEGAEAQADPATDGLSPAQHEAAKAAGVPVHLTNSIGMKLVLIPPGEYMMGSPESEEGRDSDEGPQHRVRLTKPFYLGLHEVTQGEYERVMGTNPSSFKTVSGQDTSRFPVENVSWSDAVEFCRKLSALPDERSAGREYRLPTEAQWEYACRAGTTTPFHFGSVLNGRQANVDGNYPYGTSEKGPYLNRTTTVGSYSPNGFGLYDMHGNVWEWCSDWYRGDYYANSPVDDPQGPASGSSRVTRGGSWVNSPGHCRSALRNWYGPGLRRHFLGFRLALVLADEQSSK